MRAQTSNLFYFNQLRGIVSGNVKNGGTFCRLAEAIYGIQARQSVHLTEIARALGEKIHIKKTQYRLSRQLGRDDFGRQKGLQGFFHQWKEENKQLHLFDP